MILGKKSKLAFYKQKAKLLEKQKNYLFEQLQKNCRKSEFDFIKSSYDILFSDEDNFFNNLQN